MTIHARVVVVIVWHSMALGTIITDLIMPNKDGIGMIIDLKKEFPDVKIIAMSGGGLNKPDGYLKGAKKLGAACTLTKPIDREEMLKADREILKDSQ